MLNLEDLAAIWEKHRSAANARVKEFSLGSTFFPFNSRPAVMGVINLSPDSWYRESVCLTADRAVERGRILQAQGAAIVDVGAESTLARAERVDEKMQAARLLPVIESLSAEGILISAETYNVAVTRAVLKTGAQVLNLTGPGQSEEIYRLVAEHDAAVIICYVQGPHVRAAGDFVLADDPIPLMYDYFAREIEMAARCGVQKMLLDPGLGFYYRNLQDSQVRIRHQLKTFLNSFRLRSLGFPVCQALPHAFEFFAEEVRSAEPAFAIFAALGKTDLFRTHEVPKVKAVLDLLQVWPDGKCSTTNEHQ